MPVNTKINHNIHTMRNFVECEQGRHYTITAISQVTGHKITRTFLDYYGLEAWLSTYEATQIEILNIT
jgi:hypothetical protein